MALRWEQVENLAKHGTAALSQFQHVVNQVAKDVIGQSLPSKSIEVYLVRSKNSNLPIFNDLQGDQKITRSPLPPLSLVDELETNAGDPLRFG